MHPLMNEGLHLPRVAHIVKGLLPVFGTRLDKNVARIEHALEQRLMKRDQIDFVQRNFDTLAGNDARLENDALRGEHEMRAIPDDNLGNHVDGGKCGKYLGNDERKFGKELVGNALAIGDTGKGCHEHDVGLDEPPPMRMQIEHQYFVVIEVFLRKAHVPSVMCALLQGSPSVCAWMQTNCCAG